MITFIIPLKSRKVSKSWEQVSKLAERTLKSICNQTSSNFRVVVVCNERPNIQFEHPHIHYIEVDFLIPDEENPEQPQLNKSGGPLKQDADKARKILIGIDYSSKFQSSHIMVVDADDCVSRHIAAYVEQHPQNEGWVLKQGYVYKEGSKFIYLNLKNFNDISGSTVIIRIDLFNSLLLDPAYYNHHVDEIESIHLEPLPFVGAVYTIENSENIWANSGLISKLNKQTLRQRIQALIRRMLKYKVWIVTQSITENFGLYKV